MAEPVPDAARTPSLTVVVCSLNGAAGVERALLALARQTIAPDLETVLVDDGSSDGTADAGRRHGARVVVHAENRGLGAARNSGLALARARLVAFLDDDCEPLPDWAERLVAAHSSDDVVGVGGEVVPVSPQGFMGAYLSRHNPLRPLELDLVVREDAVYRFWRYLARNWRASDPSGARRVFSLVGANMSFRADALRQVGGFDATMRFGSEDLDACMRLRDEFGDECLLLEPGARVLHHFHGDLRDTLRRSRAYGRGHSAMLAKFPTMTPTVFPLPLVTLGLLAVARRFPQALVVAAAVPHAVHPAGIRGVARHGPVTLADPYVSCLQEAAFNVGVVEGLRDRRQVGRRALVALGRLGDGDR